MKNDPRPATDGQPHVESADAHKEHLRLEECERKVDDLILDYTRFLSQDPTPSAEQQRIRRVGIANDFKLILARAHLHDTASLERYIDGKIDAAHRAQLVTLHRSHVYNALADAPGAAIGATLDVADRTVRASAKPTLRLFDAGGELFEESVDTLANTAAGVTEKMVKPGMRIVEATTHAAAHGSAAVVGTTAEALQAATSRVKNPLLSTVGDISEFATGVVVEILKGILRGLGRFGANTRATA